LTPKKAAGEWGPAFLAALSKSANVRAACQAAGISREAAYKGSFHETEKPTR
jgi:hypothetical protein